MLDIWHFRQRKQWNLLLQTSYNLAEQGKNGSFHTTQVYLLSITIDCAYSFGLYDYRVFDQRNCCFVSAIQEQDSRFYEYNK